MIPSHQSQKVTSSSHSTNPNEQQSSQDKLKSIISKLAQQHLGMTEQQIFSLLSKPLVDRLLGCLFGAFIGDSLGSYCEFYNKQKAQNSVGKAMQMLGGGPFSLLPGQITDDSEMALHMLAAFLHYDNKISLEKQKNILLISIAKQYIKWLNSNPFDIGFTTSAALNTLYPYFNKEVDKNEYTKQELMKNFQNLIKCFKDIQGKNIKSLSNGFLMRITPMVCFYALIAEYKPQDLQYLKSLLNGEVNMTHGNQICFHAYQQFVVLLSKLIRRDSFQDVQKLLQKYEQRCQNAVHTTSVQSFIKQGFDTYKNNKPLMSATIHQGYFKIAYVYSFYFYKLIVDKTKTQGGLNSNLYKQAMLKTIREGGDTDTNACIVGGLVGAILGFKNLPAQYLVKQLELDLVSKKTYRGDIARNYEPSQGFINLIKLIKKFI